MILKIEMSWYKPLENTLLGICFDQKVLIFEKLMIYVLNILCYYSFF